MVYKERNLIIATYIDALNGKHSDDNTRIVDYKNINKVMRVIKEKNLNIVSQEMNESCKIIISTRKKNAEMIFDIFNNLFEIGIKNI